jgi:hypothetical protein
MLTSIMLAALLAGASAPPPATAAGRETAIPRISGYLDRVIDPKKGVYVRGDTGKWYYARAEMPCPRLRTDASLAFVGTVQNRLDRFSSIIVEGWRCQLTSVVASDPPPGYGQHHARR